MTSMDNTPALVQIMAWRRSGDKPLSEPLMVSSPTHICFAQPQSIKYEKLYNTIKRIVTLYIQIHVHSASEGRVTDATPQIHALSRLPVMVD